MSGVIAGINVGRMEVKVMKLSVDGDDEELMKQKKKKQ
jgi:hypothetical protein